jgi:hypothetical protein
MTQLQKTSESFGGTDQRWLRSREGTDTAETVTLDHDAWAGKVVNGRLKGGEPIKITSGKYVPYAGSGSLVGFLLNDVPVRVDEDAKPDKVAPMLNRGHIDVKYLPSTVAVGATLAAGARFKLTDSAA